MQSFHNYLLVHDCCNLEKQIAMQFYLNSACIVIGRLCIAKIEVTIATKPYSFNMKVTNFISVAFW